MNQEDGNSASSDAAVKRRSGNLLSILPDAHFVIDARGVVKEYLGGGEADPVLRPSELVGQRFADLWPGFGAEQISQSIRRALKSRSDQEFVLDLNIGSCPGRYEVRLLVQGRDRLLAIFRRASVTAAEDNSFSDTLTGLAKRDFFLTRLETVLADAQLRERCVALMCIDIDRFNRINETLGRAVGDAVLKVTARRIERCFRDADRPVRIDEESDRLARLGGDEFVLVLTGIQSREDVVTVANRIQQAFSEPVTYEKHCLPITPSIGIAVFPADGSDSETLLANARAALDEARTHGENGRAFFSGTMRLRTLQRFDQKDELRFALEQDQLALNYLPRIDLASGQVIGLEALLRWISPIRGSVPLSEFIPLAEATGLMLPIGEWVLETACRHARSWAENRAERLVVSVNLSQQEFSRDDLPELVARSLSRHELRGECLQLDLKEIMLMRHTRASRVLNELDCLGVRLVIDDFGTGHSSLQRLKSLPIDALKIDRSFVEHIESEGDQRAICGAIIAMARELGLRVIAEGVENDEQLAFLRMKGCHAAQGFFYSKPLPADEVTGFLEAWTVTASDTSISAAATVREQIAR